MEFIILNLFLVLLAAWLGGQLALRLGYPSVLGELLAGILLGPPLLGLFHGSAALNVLAELGVLLMMLYMGMVIDPKDLGKASKEGILAALGGFIVPFGLGYWDCYCYWRNWNCRCICRYGNGRYIFSYKIQNIS